MFLRTLTQITAAKFLPFSRDKLTRRLPTRSASLFHLSLSLGVYYRRNGSDYSAGMDTESWVFVC